MDGLLLLDKPKQWTSHDLVDLVRRKTGLQAVGHAGTLDPMATGLMILLLGKATKRSIEFTGLDKSYRGSIRLGTVTDSWDLEGKIVGEKPVPELSVSEIQKELDSLLGQQNFVPPAFSAIKKNGVRSHARARRGEIVVSEPRPMRIDRLTLERFETPEVYFDMDCSKGTYVRSIAFVLGEKLGCGAVLSSLVRTRIGSFKLAEAMDEETFLKCPLEMLERKLR